MNELIVWFAAGVALWTVLSCLVAYFLGHHVGIHKGRDWGISVTYAELFVLFHKTLFKRERDALNATNYSYYQKEFYDTGLVFSHEYLELNPLREDR